MDKVKVQDILNYIEGKAPKAMAEPWDNVGLLVGDVDKAVNCIFVALDICEATLAEAIEEGADLIVTHHPFLFSGVKNILANDVKGSQIVRLIQNGISVISEHTNADCADVGLNAYLAKLLGVGDALPFEDTKYLRVGELNETIDSGLFAKLVKEKLGIVSVRATNVGEKSIKRVGVFTGKVDLDEVMSHKADFDVLVCGELGYHSALTLMDEGVLAFECGHYGSENIFKNYMSEELRVAFPNIEVCVSNVDSDPYMEI